MRNLFLLLLPALLLSCTNQKGQVQKPADTTRNQAAPGSVLIASDIVTDIIIKPDKEGDPWNIEKVAGYKGDAMINAIFDRVYDGSLTVYDYHTGEPMTIKAIKEIEKEYSNDRTKIGKLSFTEDWYYNPADNTITKTTKSIVLGYELYDNNGKVYGYKAAFKADFGK